MTETARQEAWRRMRWLTHHPDQLDRVHAILAEAGLRPGAGKAVAHIPLDGSIQMRDLAIALRCDNSYVTSVVDALEERGVAERRSHPSDRRIKVVCLTEEGKLLAKRVREALADPPQAFATLTASEAAQLRDLLRKLGGD
jgi:DNA-binding MarR family transcriptional regulator